MAHPLRDRRTGTPTPPRRRDTDRPLVARLDPAGERKTKRRRKRSGGMGRSASLMSLVVLLLAGLTVFTLREVAEPSQPAVADAVTPPSSASHEKSGHSIGSRVPPMPNPDPKLFGEATASAELPPGGKFTVEGKKSWTIVPGTVAQRGGPDVVTYSVEVEDGLELTGGPAGFAVDVDFILGDPRSWIGDGKHGFRRVDSGKPNLRISLTSQLTTRGICGWEIQFEGSCFTPSDNRVTINVARWVRGAVSFQGAIVEYKQYVVNHEVGHGIGYDHKPCQESGALAPVMMQQSWGVSNDYLSTLGTDRVTADGKVCKANAWPYPTGAGS